MTALDSTHADGSFLEIEDTPSRIRRSFTVSSDAGEAAMAEIAAG